MTRATKYAGFAEERTRVTIFLPAAKREHFKSLADIYKYIQQSRLSKGVRVSGYTKSVDKPPTFKGSWWGKEPTDPKRARQRWVIESVSQLILDLEGGADECEEFIRRLHRKILSAYKKYKSPQTDIWIIAHQGMRFDAE